MQLRSAYVFLEYIVELNLHMYLCCIVLVIVTSHRCYPTFIYPVMSLSQTAM